MPQIGQISRFSQQSQNKNLVIPRLFKGGQNRALRELLYAKTPITIFFFGFMHRGIGLILVGSKGGRSLEGGRRRYGPRGGLTGREHLEKL